MNHSDMVKHLSRELEISQVEVKRLLKISSETLTSILDRDKGVTIPGVGTFFAGMKKARKAYNPYHQRMMLLPKKRVVKFHVSSHLKSIFKNVRVEE